MNGTMETFKKELLDKINGITTFDEFDIILGKMSNETKGIFFEIFFKLYFVIFPTCRAQYSKVYLYHEIPEKLKSKLKLPEKDKGIDGIVVTSSKEYHAVQVKYRKNRKPIAFGELATFPALTFGTCCQNIKGGVFFTNCYDVCEELKNDKYQNVTYHCFNKCDNDFWNNAINCLASDIVTNFVPHTPLPHQEKILSIIKKYFEENDFGRLYLPCGTGKSLMCVFTAINILNYTKIFIAVPSLHLLSETYETWIKQLYKDKKFTYLLIGSDIDKKKDLLCEYKITTNKDEIKKQLDDRNNIVVIVTYQSSKLLKEACKELKFKFDIGIYDEAHRTVGTHNKKFTILLSYKKLSKKRLFMTATEKIYYHHINKFSKEQHEEILSMDNEDIYGKVIYNYSTRQAIEDNQLVNYNVIAPFISTDKYDEMLENNDYVQINKTIHEIKLLLLAVMIVEVLKENSIKHLLIFSNKNEKAKRILEMIEKLLEKEDFDVFTKYLNGSDNITKRKYQVKLFEQSERGIISSARIFGEGVNIPVCDAVCFADNKGSTVDIIQCVGRCLRKCKTKPNKISHVIVPFVLDNKDDFFDCENKSFFKLRKILKSLGTMDDMISEKFVLKDCNKISSIGSDDKMESICQLFSGKKIDLDEFKQQIISKIFDKNGGNPENRIRNKIINENKKRLLNNQKSIDISNNENYLRWLSSINLIDTQKKCLEFLHSEYENKMPKTKNWIKFCLGNDIFLELTKKYYYSKTDLCQSCNKLGIINFESYKKKYMKDERLPHPNYINDGFYQDLDEKFNIDILLQKNSCLLNI